MNDNITTVEPIINTQVIPVPALVGTGSVGDPGTCDRSTQLLDSRLREGMTDEELPRFFSSGVIRNNRISVVTKSTCLTKKHGEGHDRI